MHFFNCKTVKLSKKIWTLVVLLHYEAFTGHLGKNSHSYSCYSYSLEGVFFSN